MVAEESVAATEPLQPAPNVEGADGTNVAPPLADTTIPMSEPQTTGDPAPDQQIDWSSSERSATPPPASTDAAPADPVNPVAEDDAVQVDATEEDGEIPVDTVSDDSATDDGSRYIGVDPHDLTLEQRVAAQEAIANRPVDELPMDFDDLDGDFGDFEFDEAPSVTVSTLAEPPVAEVASAIEVPDASRSAEADLATAPEAIDTPKELQTLEKSVRRAKSPEEKQALMDSRFVALQAHPELLEGTSINHVDDYNDLVRRMEGMQDDDPQKTYCKGRIDALKASDESLATAMSDYNNLSEEMQKYASGARGVERNWTAVERAFDKMISLGLQPKYHDYFLAAQAARDRGDVDEVVDRLHAAHALNPTTEVNDWISDIERNYGQVDITLAANLRNNLDVFKPVITPWAPDQRAAIDAAKTSLTDTGSFSGSLPAGTYVLNGANIVVTAGGHLDVNNRGTDKSV